MATKLRNLLLSRPVNIYFTRWNSSKNQIAVYDPFKNAKNKDKDTYLKLVKVFEGRDTRRRGHVEFIYAALARMHEFGVQKDLEVYKALVDVLPKGKLIPTNIFQAEFFHYPKQQQCAVDLLEQMENNGVMPDSELETMLLNVFGRRGIALRKYWRMLYWMPKFKNLSPFYLPEKLPVETVDLAVLAIQRITSVDPDTEVQVWKAEDIPVSLDKTWIVSAQSPAQQVLLETQPPTEPLVVKGPYKVYLRDQVVSYFLLLGAIRNHHEENVDQDDVSKIDTPVGIPGVIGKTVLPAVNCTVHEQDDGTIVAACATGTSSRDSLLSWIRLLEKNGNPVLANLPVIFTLISPPTEISVTESLPKTNESNASAM